MLLGLVIACPEGALQDLEAQRRLQVPQASGWYWL